MSALFRMSDKVSSTAVDDRAPAPRLCRIRQVPGFDGYGFNLQAESGRPGQFVHAVDERSPAAAAGLRDGDRIVEVNGAGVSLLSHREVRVVQLARGRWTRGLGRVGSGHAV